MDRIPYLFSTCTILCVISARTVCAQVPVASLPTPPAPQVQAGPPIKAELIPAPKFDTQFAEPAPNPAYLGEQTTVSVPPSAVFNRRPVLAGTPGCDCCGTGQQQNCGLLMNCASQSGPCCCVPKWTISASAIAFMRTNPGNATLFSSPAGTPLLDASQYNFGYHVGFDLSLRRSLGAASEVEFRYFGIDQWTATGPTFSFAAGSTVGTNPPTVVGAPGTQSSRYQSALHSGEINYWQSLSSTWKMGVGFRMLQVNENLALNNSLTVPLDTRLDWDVDNRLYGFQLGTEGSLWQYNNFSLNGVVKTGVYANRADSTFQGRAPLSTLFAVSQAKSTNAAFVGEAGLTGVYRFSRNMALRAGYQVLFVDGVSLASDQVSNTGSATAGGVVSSRMDSSSILYHGGSLGLEFRW